MYTASLFPDSALNLIVKIIIDSFRAVMLIGVVHVLVWDESSTAPERHERSEACTGTWHE